MMDACSTSAGYEALPGYGNSNNDAAKIAHCIHISNTKMDLNVKLLETNAASRFSAEDCGNREKCNELPILQSMRFCLTVPGYDVNG
jgi:hypothetical protein